jgi:RHS repeat-associated protein
MKKVNEEVTNCYKGSYAIGMVSSRVLLLMAVLLMVSSSVGLHGQFTGTSVPVLDNSQHIVRLVYSSKATGSQLANDSKVITNIPSTGCTSQTTVITNYVKLRIVPDIKRVVDKAFSVTLKLEISRDNIVEAGTREMTISYDPKSGTTYKDIDVYRFSNSKNTTVTIKQIDPKEKTISEVWDLIELINEAEVGVNETFEGSVTPANFTINKAELPNYLNLSWDRPCGTSEYDLEWLYVDDYDMDVNSNVIYTTESTLDYDFRRGATRITLSQNTYRLPMIYEHGYLLFRIRSASRGMDGESRQLGAWTLGTINETGKVNTVSSTYKHFIETVQVHESDKKNWQVIATYAEEGLRKDVVSYYDGTYRKRQTVTKSSTDDKAIIAETIYDHQGRPAINVLPAPVQSNQIRYYTNFNQNSTGTPYNRVNFDKDNGCTTPIGKMKTDGTSGGISVGASNYYSPSNALLTTEEGKAIPDAEGYPFSVTEYTRDNTGRISRQSGLGGNYIDGTTGLLKRATQYYYGTPSQEELDRLFGNEVGHAIHYKKNMIQDANGQLSVSYIDADGKTIATALAGAKPTNVEKLSTQNEVTLSADLLSKNHKDVGSKSITATHTQLVTTAGEYSFGYDVKPQYFSTTGFQNMNLCYDCVYDLEIVVQKANTCDEPVYKKLVTLGSLFKTVDPMSVSRDCDISQYADIPTNFKVTLEVGAYTITKRLIVNEQSVNRYVEDYLSTFTPLKEAYRLEELAKVDLSACEIKCETCEANALTSKELSFTSAVELTKLCKELCNTGSSTMEGTRLAMLQDMTPPYGQYAEVDIDPDNPETITALGTLSIFNDKNSLPKANTKWRNPSIIYKNEIGEADKIYNKAGELVVPNDESITLKEFIDNFKPTWAEALLEFHPEACLLGWGDIIKTSDEFDNNLATVDTWVEGSKAPPTSQTANISIGVTSQSSGYATGITYGIVDNDPYFSTSYGSADKAAFIDKISNYITDGGYNLLQASILTYSCPNAYNNTLRMSCLQGHQFGIDPIADDTIFINFTGFYGAEKQRIMMNGRTAYSNANNCNTECIGLYHVTGVTVNLPCNNSQDKLYEEKIKRFATVNDVLAEQTGGKDIFKFTEEDTKKYEVDYRYLNPDCVECNLERDWETFLNGYFSTRTEIKDVDVIDGVKCRFMTHNLFENLGKPSVITIRQEGDGAQLTFRLGTATTGSIVMQLVRGGDDVWTAGSSIKINRSSFATNNPWAKVKPSYDLFKIIVTTATGVESMDNTVKLISAKINPCYVPPTQFYAEYPISDRLLEVADISFYSIAAGSGILRGMWQMDGWEINGIDNSIRYLFDPNPRAGLTQRELQINGLVKYLNLIDGNNTWYYDINSQSVKGGVANKVYGKLSLMGTNTQIWGTYYMYHPQIGKSGFFVRSTRPTPFDKGYTDFNFSSNGTFIITPKYLANVYAIKDKMNAHDPAAEWDLIEAPCNSATGSFPCGTVSANMIYIYNKKPTQKTYTGGNYREGYFKEEITPQFYTTPVVDPRPDCAKAGITTPCVNAVYTYEWDNSVVKMGKELIRVEWERGCDKPSKVIGSKQGFMNFMAQADKGASWTNENGKYQFRGGNGNTKYGKMTFYKLDANGQSILPAIKEILIPDVDIKDIATINYKVYNGNTGAYENKPISTGCGTCGTDTPLTPEVVPDAATPCEKEMKAAAEYNAEVRYKEFIEAARTDIANKYIERCMSAVNEQFNVSYKTAEYHYTLYYYDQANNLVKTVPPTGVKIITDAPTLVRIKSHRKGEPVAIYYAPHTFETVYHYNSLNQVMDQKTPDAGVSTFLYDRLGRLIVSQNARQKLNRNTNTNLFIPAYSYTLFDALGRITEVGEIENNNPLSYNLTVEVPRNELVCENKTVERTRPILVASYEPRTITIPGVGTFNYSVRVDVPGTETYTEVVQECREVPVTPVPTISVPIVVNKSETRWQQWLSQGTRRQMTQTQYDSPLSTAIADLFGAKKQENPRNRVTSTMYKEKQTDATFQHATHYSYDIMGNVKTLIQDYPEFAKKRMDYQYDQLSGKVNMVAYQHGQVDAFYHRYKYDADLRLRSAETSRDQVIWDCEAVYKYYRHGPMRRREIGHEHIQGMDYYYTLQGWIKGVNHGAGAEDALGNDGKTGTVYGNFGKDAFAYNLSYHTDDYKPISANFADVSKRFVYDLSQTNGGNKAALESLAPSLYNGNIRAMWGGLDKFVVPAGNSGKGGGNTPVIPTAQGQVFKYDQLNRLIQSRDYTMTGQQLSNATEHHGMNLTYDGNGNIQTLKRKGVDKKGAVMNMDDLGYEYKAGTNQLIRVRDVVDKKNFDNDIDDQDAVLENYTYDAIGNLKTDVSEGITNITWNVYGKMTTVIKTKEKESQFYYYDAGGNRVKKKDGNDKETFYVWDAQGNVMATYEREKPNKDLMVSSFYIYGSSRIGSLDAQVNMQTATVPTTQFSRIRGQRRYEMSNHLGNVMVVVSDRKVVQTDGSTLADLVSTTDYYAFGMVMSDRSWNTEGYRYGFNGKENDNEIKGTGNQQDYGMRIYDPRLGRFLSVDPITKNYPWLTPYQFASNTPIQAIDQDGLESTNVNTGETDKTLSGDNLKKYNENREFGPWKDLIEFKNEDAFKLANSRQWWTLERQPIENAQGPGLNLDYYSVTIDKLPDGYTSPTELLNYMRKNFSDFKKNGGSNFEEYSSSEGKIFQSKNPVSALMRFEVYQGGVNIDDLTVITSDAKSNYWVFTPVASLFDSYHPVSGNRQFGIIENDNGSFTFYTRGADRPTNVVDALVAPVIFSGAHKLWTAVMNNVSDFVNKNGGSAKINPSISKRIYWDEYKYAGKGIPLKR